MTTPTNSDRLREDEPEVTRPRSRSGVAQARVDNLRKRLLAKMAPTGIPLTDSERGQVIDALLPVIEAEINKLNAEKAETIEALESAPEGPDFEYNPLWWVEWYIEKCEPLLDKLKGSPDQTKEGSPDTWTKNYDKWQQEIRRLES